MARHINKTVLPLALVLCFLFSHNELCAATNDLHEFDLGFIASRDRDLKGNIRLRVLGPFFERLEHESGMRFTALRPLGSSFVEPEKDRSLRELIWPVGMYKKFRGQTAWRFLIAYGDDYDNTQPGSRWRFVIFPIVFAGKDANGENYFGVIPLGGKINEFLGKDNVSFLLFPLYFSNTLNGVTTRSVLWPLISRTNGGDIDRFSVLPFYGRVINKERWTKRYAMWPVWTSVKYEYPGVNGGGFILFPIVGHMRVDFDNQNIWWLFPPLLKWAKTDRNTMVHCPWPVIQYARGSHLDRLYVWPIWGTKTIGHITSTFMLWPLGGTERTLRKTYTLNKFTFRPFLNYESRVPRPGPRQDAAADASAVRTADITPPEQSDGRYFQLWPLFSYRRRANMSRFRVFDFWPAQHMTGIEKNWAPIWTIYAHARVGDASEDELFWGFVRHRKDGRGGRRFSVFPLFSIERTVEGDRGGEWSFLLGFMGCEREGLRKTYRLLYFIKWHRDKSERKIDVALNRATDKP
ncbi:MAG: hypothetical protein JXN60_09345 [Lentisphaerae bacterium]|nr:hypothetical protein [Lentisphaerota bacterium]